MNALLKSQKSLLAGVAIFLLAALLLVGEEGDPGVLAEAKGSFDHIGESRTEKTPAASPSSERGFSSSREVFAPEVHDIEESGPPQTAESNDLDAPSQRAGTKQGVAGAHNNARSISVPQPEKDLYLPGEINIKPVVRKLQ